MLRDRYLIHLARRILLVDLVLELLGESRTSLFKLCGLIAFTNLTVMRILPRPLCLYAGRSLERFFVFRTLSTLAHQCPMDTLLLYEFVWIEELRLIGWSVVCLAILIPNKAWDDREISIIIQVYTDSWTRSTSLFPI